MSLNIVRRIICEKSNSEIVPRGPRNDLQRFRLSRLYELLVVLRVFLTLNMQTGWIHQDEFTNSIEVMAGDYFNLQVLKTSAFNATQPTRSTAFLHATLGLPYILGYHYLSFKHDLGKEFIPNTRILILLPRLFHVLLSFSVDFIMMKFCQLQARKNRRHLSDEDEVSSQISSSDDEHSFHLITLATSQVLLIFTSRTHSSSINLVLFSALIYFVSDSLYRMEDYLPILNKYHQTDGKKNPQIKVLLLRQLKATGYTPIQKLHWIALITTIGVFNDPDFFLSYAVVPIFFYLQRGIGNRNIGITHFHARCFIFLGYFFAFSIPFILWDSFYYGKVTWADFININLSPYSFVITPVNYFATKNVTLRNWWTFAKVFITYLALFNVLGIMGLISFLKEVYDISYMEWKFKPRLDSQWTFLNCSLFIPLFILIPFKSAFDLIPLIFPLTCMHGHKIPILSHFNKKICLAWFVFNLLGILYWGYLSRGGILTSFFDLYDKLVPIRFNQTQVDIILMQMTAIPPTFVLAIPSLWKSFLPPDPNAANDDLDDLDDGVVTPSLPKTVLRVETESKIRIFHTGFSDKPIGHLESELSRLIRKSSNADYAQGLKINFVILPTILRGKAESGFRTLRLHYLRTYWNHIEFDWLFNDELELEQSKYMNASIGLDIYRLEPFDVVANEKIFESIFHFKSDKTTFITFFIDFFLSSLTMFFFIMTYIAFLM